MVCQHLPIYLKDLHERCQYQCALCRRSGFSKTSSTWCPGNSWQCTVHLLYSKICRPASSLSGKTCKRTRNHEAGGLCQWDILCNGELVTESLEMHFMYHFVNPHCVLRQ